MGSNRYLAEHARVAARVTGGETTVLLAEDGDVIRLAPGEGRIVGRVAAGRLLIDGTRSGEVGSESCGIAGISPPTGWSCR